MNGVLNRNLRFLLAYLSTEATQTLLGDVAEGLGRGLQSLVRRFESARHLTDRNKETRPGSQFRRARFLFLQARCILTAYFPARFLS